MNAPHGTTVIDVADPRNPHVIATLEVPQGYHSHKVRAANGTMVVNHEKIARDADAEFGGGLGIYDISNPAKPVLRAKWKTAGKGVHRFSFDGRFAYISPTVEGYVDNIVMILDLADPANPQEVGRWWYPGQWTAGGEEPPELHDGRRPRCHHPLRLGDRPLRELLAARRRDPRHQRHDASGADLAHRHERRLSAPDAHAAHDARAAQGPPRDGGRR